MCNCGKITHGRITRQKDAVFCAVSLASLHTLLPTKHAGLLHEFLKSPDKSVLQNNFKYKRISSQSCHYFHLLYLQLLPCTERSHEHSGVTYSIQAFMIICKTKEYWISTYTPIYSRVLPLFWARVSMYKFHDNSRRGYYHQVHPIWKHSASTLFIVYICLWTQSKLRPTSKYEFKCHTKLLHLLTEQHIFISVFSLIQTTFW